VGNKLGNNRAQNCLKSPKHALLKPWEPVEIIYVQRLTAEQ